MILDDKARLTIHIPNFKGFGGGWGHRSYCTAGVFTFVTEHDTRTHTHKIEYIHFSSV